jgi:hypothetical protein
LGGDYLPGVIKPGVDEQADVQLGLLLHVIEQPVHLLVGDGLGHNVDPVLSLFTVNVVDHGRREFAVGAR